MDEAILIPVKAFHRAKSRLRGAMTDSDRIRIARWTANRVLDVALARPTFVACDDPTVATWATERGAQVVWGPGLGLNGAIDQAVAQVAAAGHDHVTICHSDLPLPDQLLQVAVPDTVVLVPDDRDDGTNVLSRPVNADIPASYGANSFGAHLGLAVASGLAVRVTRYAGLALDLDVIDDIRHPLIESQLRDLFGSADWNEQ